MDFDNKINLSLHHDHLGATMIKHVIKVYTNYIVITISIVITSRMLTTESKLFKRSIYLSIEN